MRLYSLLSVLIFLPCISFVVAQNATFTHVTSVNPVASESVGDVGQQTATVAPVAPVATNVVSVNGQNILANTSVATNATILVNSTSSATSTSSTILILARDDASAYSAYSVLNGYAIPYQVLIVPQGGVALPALNGSSKAGNFGAIVVMSEVSYDYGDSGGGFQSALTPAQWAALYTYQHSFGVRMVRLDVFPSADSGTSALGGCCEDTQEQSVWISNNTGFASAGLTLNAKMSTLGLYHYPAKVTNSSIATAFATFGTTTGFSKASTAGVINNIAGREQMVFFIGFATDWSSTSTFLSHAWIQWATRGLYAGFRRVYFGTQVDDMFLPSAIYSPAGTTFRIRTGDLTAIKNWMPTLNAKLPAGSQYFMEIGHNGNGNIANSDALDKTHKLCAGGPIQYNTQDDTPLEFEKPLGSGTNIWPSNLTAYPYSATCTSKDPLKVWWATAANRDAFAHVSHTFSHESENNSTFYDIFNEISWNQAWLAQVGLDKAARFSSNGLIPPAITGLHNGDALRAWVVRGIKNAVGDNTRPALLNTQNEHWPLITTIADNGYDGVQITPRWATNIYYNCDTADCTVQEWIDESSGSGTIHDLLAIEKQSTSLHLLGLHHDPYMFHQANLRQTDVKLVTINGVSKRYSLIQMWVETVVQEMIRIVNWPIISLKHDDIATTFANRMARDNCGIGMTYLMDAEAQQITGVQVTSNGNTCSAAIPVTLPGAVLDTKGFETEQAGNDPLTVWVQMTGAPVTLTLQNPVAW